jgi:hypothetical protein
MTKVAHTEGRLEAISRERPCALHGCIADETVQGRKIRRLQPVAQLRCERSHGLKRCQIESHRFDLGPRSCRFAQHLDRCLRTPDVTAGDILRIESGKITDNWYLEDNRAFQQQIGAIKR